MTDIELKNAVTSINVDDARQQLIEELIKNYNVSETTEEDDPLLKIINGSDENE